MGTRRGPSKRARVSMNEKNGGMAQPRMVAGPGILRNHRRNNNSPATGCQEYETGLQNRLVDLHSRVHRGAYRAKPSRRVYIEKADGRQRPLGVAALEDKVVQQAVVTILNQIYEEDFLGFSYGFRPGRSQHQALDALSYALLRKKVNYVLDADIRGFFRQPRQKLADQVRRASRS